MSEINVRDAVPKDAEPISQLLERVISSLEIYSPEARRREVAKYDTTSMSEIIRTGIVIVAEKEGHIVGTCLGYDDDALVWLSWFVVDPDYRRRRLTLRMLERFLERARSVSHKVWCDCRTSNEASIRLLERSGFDRIATLAKHWYGQDFILWQKPLESA
jgi:RimJ/RimL family protein N-acetyltransferase